MSTINCPNCNSENAAENAHCLDCGASLQDTLISNPVQSAEAGSDPENSGAEETTSPTLPESPAGEDEAAPEKDESTLTKGDDLDDWLRELPPPTAGELGKTGRQQDADGALPTWLQEVRAKADEQMPTNEPELGDWLTGLEHDDSTPAAAGQPDDKLPDWVSALTQPEKWPEADEPEAMAKWFANAEDADDQLLPQTSELPMTQPLDPSQELDGIPELLAGDELPGWLMQDAGVDEAPESAEFRPSDRKPVVKQTADHSPADESMSKQDEPFLEELPSDDEPTSSVDERNLVAAAALATAGADEKLDWLEEIEDQEVDAALDEILLTESVVIDDQEVEGILDQDPLADEMVTGAQDVETILDETLLPDELDNGDQDVEPVLDEILLLEELESEDQDVEATFDEVLFSEELVDESPTSGSGDWLEYLDGAPEAEIAESLPEPELRSDLELEQAKIPEWLRGMKPGESGRSHSRLVDEVKEESGPLAGLRGVIPVAVAATGTGQIAEPARFEITKEQQEQVALLNQLTVALPDRPLVESVAGEEDGFATERLVLGVLLLLIVLVGWFLPVDRWLPFLSEWTVPEATEAAYQVVDQFEEKTALLAFEYTPAMAGELDVIADSVLARLAANNSTVLTVSQAAAGVVMAQEALERSNIEQTYDLGFLPGDAVGLRGLGNCLNANGECNSMVGLPLDGEAALLLEDVSLVIILTGDRDSLVNWVEQVGLQTEAPMLAGLTQSLGPVSSPYLASEQLVGVIEGAPASAIYDYSLQGTDNQGAQLLRSLTLAQWLVIAVMIAGGLYFGVLKRSNKAAFETDVR